MVSLSAMMSNQFIAGMRKHVTLMILQNLQIIGGLEVANV
jgi:hypothetical protein